MTIARRFSTAVLLLVSFTVVLGGYGSGPDADRPEKPNVPEKPNIIVMYSDDHTAQAVGAYQEALDYGLQLDHSPTPNIDRLAENGMRFDNAFVGNSICVPSRVSMLSGVHSHISGATTNADSLPTGLTTFPPLLQKSGYQTAMFGKWHLKTEPRGFDYYQAIYGQGPYYNPTLRTPEGDIDREGHTSEVITESALQWLQSRRDEEDPFMMVYNHKAPHRNWLPGPDHLDDYRDRDLPEPSSLFYDHSGLATPASEQDMEIENTMSWGWDLKVPEHPETRETSEGWEQVIDRNDLTADQLDRIKQAYAEANQDLYDEFGQMSSEEKLRWKYQRYVKDYLRTIRGLDDGVGRVMDYLEREGLLDNTVVVYAGDQGFFLGENGWFDKRWMYEESMRQPLVVHWPEGIEPGSVSEQLVQNIDIAPTILDLAGAEIPDDMQGRSLKPLLTGDDPGTWRDAVYYQYFEGPPAVHSVAQHYGVRTDRYTLVHYPNHDEWELFDLEEDPEQLNSVYGDPDYADVQDRLTERLSELQDQHEDDSWTE
jgi:arylsulfatase A-like enzyme